jgi:hypothetical protein
MPASIVPHFLSFKNKNDTKTRQIGLLQLKKAHGVGSTTFRNLVCHRLLDNKPKSQMGSSAILVARGIQKPYSATSTT